MKNQNRLIRCNLMILGVFLIITQGCTKKKDNTSPDTQSIIKDIDGNSYTSVIIGKQVWMAENLKTTKYRNGEPIPEITDSLTWLGLSTGAYCNYNNDASIAQIYGKLYNGYAVNDPRNIAPEGWHIASQAEWDTMMKFIDGPIAATTVGNKLKEAGTAHWKSPNNLATNSSGLNILPSGERDYGRYLYLGEAASIWTSTEIYPPTSNYRKLIYGNNGSIVGDNYMNKKFGLTVRCIKD